MEIIETFLSKKSNLEHFFVVLTTPKTSPEKLTPTVVQMQQSLDIEKTDSRRESFCLKWTKYKGWRKNFENFKTDTDKLNVVVYRYQKSFHLEDIEIYLKIRKDRTLLAKLVHVLSYVDISDKLCSVVD